MTPFDAMEPGEAFASPKGNKGILDARLLQRAESYTLTLRLRESALAPPTRRLA